MAPSYKEGSDSNKLLSLKELRELISSISNMRDKLMIRILYETGCDLNELVSIKVEDILGNKIKIRNIRYVKISGKLAKDLKFYIKGNSLSKDSNIISTRQSKKISQRRVRQLIQGYTEKKGYGKINPQMFRYYHVAHAYLNGVYQENMAKQLGIKTYRIFQIINQMNIQPDNMYNKFLTRI